jgi:hypothetical protein
LPETAPASGPPSFAISEAMEMLVDSRLSQWFRNELKSLRETLDSVPSDLAGEAWREGGWTRKQIVGHLLDSAANNRQRFVRAEIDGQYVGPSYTQDGWVAAHGYAEQSWKTLLEWWDVEHEILSAVVDRIPEDRLDASCNVGEDAPVTLRFLIEDYIRHQQWHVRQMAA